VVAGNTTDWCHVLNIILIVDTRMLLITWLRSACGIQQYHKDLYSPYSPPPCCSISVYNYCTQNKKRCKIGKNRVTSFTHCAGSRHNTEDLKTDPKKGLHKENFEPFCASVAQKIDNKKHLKKIKNCYFWIFAINELFCKRFLTFNFLSYGCAKELKFSLVKPLSGSVFKSSVLCL